MRFDLVYIPEYSCMSYLKIEYVHARTHHFLKSASLFRRLYVDHSLLIFIAFASFSCKTLSLISPQVTRSAAFSRLSANQRRIHFTASSYVNPEFESISTSGWLKNCVVSVDEERSLLLASQKQWYKQFPSGFVSNTLHPSNSKGSRGEV